MSKLNRVTLSLALAMGISFAAFTSVEAAEQAKENCSVATQCDTVIYGNIYTAANDKSVNALVIKDGVIIYAGDKTGAKKYEKSAKEVMRLPKKHLVIPGLIDGHAHPAIAWSDKLNSLMFKEEDTLDIYKEKLTKYIKDNPDKAYYKATGWLDSRFPNGLPTAAMLDEICPDKPIVATDGGGHGIWVNTEALKQIFAKHPELNYELPERPGKDIISFPGGTIERDANGKAIGCFRDNAVMIPRTILPKISKVDYIQPIKNALAEYASLGYTAFNEAMINESVDLNIVPKLEVYTELEANNELPIYVQGSYIVNNSPKTFDLLDKALALKESTKGGNFEVVNVKIFMDGVVEGGSAYLSKDYANKPGYKGTTGWNSEEDLEKLTKVIEVANGAGMTCHFHAIGDQASTNALDCIAKAAEKIGIEKVKACRNTITHLQIVDPSAYDKFVKYNVVASLSPWGVKLPNFFKETEVAMLGEERANSEYPLKTFINKGVNCAFGTDYGSSFDYTFNNCYYRLIARKYTNCDPATELNAAEKLSPTEALKIMTIGGAYQMQHENDFGTLEVGKKANLVVLDQNLFAIKDDQAVKTQTLATMTDGKWIFKK